MQKLGMLVFAVAVVGLGCGGSTTTAYSPPPGAVTYQLPGAANIDIPPGGCIIVNAAPQSLPASTVSYTLSDLYSDAFEVGVVPSTFTCQFPPSQSYVDDIFVGSATDSAAVPPGTYDLDVICQNATVDCLLDTISWSATY